MASWISFIVKVGNSNTSPFKSRCWGSLAWSAIFAAGAGEFAPDLVVGAIFPSSIKQGLQMSRYHEKKREGQKLGTRRRKGDMGFSLIFSQFKPQAWAQRSRSINFLNPFGHSDHILADCHGFEGLAGLVKMQLRRWLLVKLKD